MADITISFNPSGVQATVQAMKAMQKELAKIAQNTKTSSETMKEFLKAGKQFQGLGKAVKALTKEMQGLGATLKSQVNLKATSQDAKAAALEMINLRDAGSAFVIIAQQIGQSMEETRDEFREFNVTMQQTAALITKTGEDVNAAIRDNMTAAVNELAIETVLDSREVAMALREVVAMGFSGADSFMILRAGAFAAVAGLGEVGETTELVVNVIRSFGLEASDAAVVAAQLTFIANETSLQMDEMGIAMQFAAAQAGIMGFDLAEVAAILGLMRDSGIKASRAGTSLRQFLVRLADPTSEARDLLNRLNIEFVNAEGEFLSLTQIMKNVISGLEGMTDAQKAQITSTLFEVRGQTALNLVNAQGIERLEALTEGARFYTDEQESANFVTETAGKMNASLAKELENSEERLRQASRIIAENTVPAVIAFNNAQSASLELLGNFHPALQGVAGIIAETGVRALESAGNIFLMVTSFETGGKQIKRLIARFRELDIVQRTMNSRIGQSIGRLRRFKFAAIGAGLALGGVAVGMAAVSAEGETERAVLSVLTGIMFALAAASVAAAIAKEAVRSHPLVAIALAVGLAAAIAAATHIVASQAAATRETARQGEETFGQRGAFIAGRPGQGRRITVGEGTQSEFVLPEPMLREVIHEEMGGVKTNMAIMFAIHGFRAMAMDMAAEARAQRGAFIASSPGDGRQITVGEGVQSEFVLPEPLLRNVVREELENIIIRQNITQDRFIFNIPPFSRVSERDARKWADVITESKRRDLRLK